MIIKNNLKTIFEFGKTRKKILKKYLKIWRFITFNLEPVTQSSSRIKKTKEDNDHQTFYEHKYKKEDPNDNKKYHSKSKSNNSKLSNINKNNQNMRMKLLKREKFLKQIIETLDDYKQIVYYMSKWYYLSKNKKKKQKTKKK